MTAKLAILALALVAAPAAAAERTYDLAGFQEVRSAGPDDVTVVTGAGYSVVATGDPRDLDRMLVELREGQLWVGRVRGRDSWFSGSKAVKVRVTLPTLRSVSLSGSGSVVADRLKGDTISASLSGSGNLRVAASAGRTVEIYSSGSGNLTLASVEAGSVAGKSSGSGGFSAAGRCTSGELSSSGSGGIDARRLACQAIKVSVSGSGDVTATASREARLTSTGSGSAIVDGSPPSCLATARGSGSARCR